MIIIPSILSLLLGAGSAYVGHKYQRITSNSAEEMRQVKERINASQCDASYKSAALSIVDSNVKLIGDYSSLYYEFSAASFVIGIVGIGVFVGVRRKEHAQLLKGD